MDENRTCAIVQCLGVLRMCFYAVHFFSITRSAQLSFESIFKIAPRNSLTKASTNCFLAAVAILKEVT